MIIAVISNKGGTGKTTTSVNLSAALAISGYKVLLIDLDPQSSASLSLGIKQEDFSPSLAEVFFDDFDLKETIRNTGIDKLQLITGGIKLAHSDFILADEPDREMLLSDTLECVKNDYDFIICDCAPSFSIMPVNAFVACDVYIVPIVPEYLSVEGLLSLMDVVEQMKEGFQIEPELLGVLFTMVKSPFIPFLDREYKNQMEVMKLVKENLGDKVFKTLIRRDPELSRAPSYNKSIIEFAPGSYGYTDYMTLAREVIKYYDFIKKTE
jgi:chromosome partitioning protein